MSREVQASAVLTVDQLALLAVHRLCPERTLPDLLEGSGHVHDPARACVFHFQSCDTCPRAALFGEGDCCRRGARLIERARGWRPRATAAA